MDNKNNTTDSFKNMTDIIESLGWTITSMDNGYVSLQIYSPDGQDFNIDIPYENDIESFEKNLYQYYLSFDVSTEAYYSLDNSGHGANGAPYEMIDVYNDMEWCKNAILDLYDKLEKIA